MTATSLPAPGFGVSEPVDDPVARGGRVRAWRARRKARFENAGAVRDVFLDVVVLLSVLEFLALVAGFGLLVMGSHAPWPR